jgi:hypothetical protein
MIRSKLIGIPSVFIAAISVVACQRAADSAAPAATADAASARPAPVDEFREITIPVGTTLTVSLDDAVGSATSHVDDAVHAHLTRPVSVDGVVAAPEGSELSGAVVEAQQSARVKGRAELAIRFDKLRLPDGGETYPIRTPAITREAAGTMKKDAMKVGIPAGVGAVVGGLLGGGKGAAIGAGVGGGGGAAYVMSQRGPEVAMNRGATLTVRLEDEVKVRVRASAAVTTAAN